MSLCLYYWPKLRDVAVCYVMTWIKKGNKTKKASIFNFGRKNKENELCSKFSGVKIMSIFLHVPKQCSFGVSGVDQVVYLDLGLNQSCAQRITSNKVVIKEGKCKHLFAYLVLQNSSQWNAVEVLSSIVINIQIQSLDTALSFVKPTKLTIFLQMLRKLWRFLPYFVTSSSGHFLNTQNLLSKYYSVLTKHSV